MSCIIWALSLTASALRSKAAKRVAVRRRRIDGRGNQKFVGGGIAHREDVMVKSI